EDAPSEHRNPVLHLPQGASMATHNQRSDGVADPQAASRSDEGSPFSGPPSDLADEQRPITSHARSRPAWVPNPFRIHLASSRQTDSGRLIPPEPAVASSPLRNTSSSKASSRSNRAARDPKCRSRSSGRCDRQAMVVLPRKPKSDPRPILPIWLAATPPSAHGDSDLGDSNDPDLGDGIHRSSPWRPTSSPSGHNPWHSNASSHDLSASNTPGQRSPFTSSPAPDPRQNPHQRSSDRACNSPAAPDLEPAHSHQEGVPIFSSRPGPRQQITWVKTHLVQNSSKVTPPTSHAQTAQFDRRSEQPIDLGQHRLLAKSRFDEPARKTQLDGERPGTTIIIFNSISVHQQQHHPIKPELIQEGSNKFDLGEIRTAVGNRLRPHLRRDIQGVLVRAEFSLAQWAGKHQQHANRIISAVHNKAKNA
ncbi:hypothetical protein ACLOJK_029248, partial [Asimina triloba]